MSALKNKLAEKVEIIESKSALNNNLTVNEANGTLNNTLEHQDNVIILKNTDNQTLCSIVPSFAITLNEAKERVLMLQSFVKEMMIPNIDYGLIPKCDKPTLFKSGAEKLCDIFGFSKQIEILNRLEDFDKGLFHYEIKVILINKRTGIIEAEGIGSCNSREKKYKNQDSFSLINTILKMSKKRALIDAVLSATRSSGIFTQDIEDLDQESSYTSASNNNQYSANKNRSNNNSNKSNKDNAPVPITKEQQSEIFITASNHRIPIDYVKTLMIEHYNVAESKLLSNEQANEFIGLLNQYSSI